MQSTVIMTSHFCKVKQKIYYLNVYVFIHNGSIIIYGDLIIIFKKILSGLRKKNENEYWWKIINNEK